MSAKVTLDTNILIYAIDSSAGEKQKIASKLVLQAAIAKQPLPLQTLNELCCAVRRKNLAPASSLHRIVRTHNESFTIVPPAVDDLMEALRAVDEHHLQFWDALLWATARRAGCTILFSEDFQDGRVLGGVRFVNPFKLSRRELKALIS